MNDKQQSEQQQPDMNEIARQVAEVTEKSQNLVQAFWARQMDEASGEEFKLVDPMSVGRAFSELGAALLADPAKLVAAQTAYMQQSFALWDATLRRMQGEEVAPLVEPARGDRRFKDPAWGEDLVFDYLKQSYLMASRWVQGVCHDVDGLDPKVQEKVDFYTRQFVSASSPSNFAFTNPQVLRKAKETGGENLVKGLKNLIGDLEKGKGRLKISMTDAAAFEVGKNVAVTPGKVVFQNDLMQLIQYNPSTETVHKRPMLFVPPWINKFYVMDLQPKNSLIKWVVDQGHTLFIVSWVNPRADLAHKRFDDYMLEGPLAALDAIEAATGEREVNVLGFCIGGILTVATLAYMATKGDDRINSATFLATMVDLQDVGEVSVFVDEEQLQSIERHTANKGYLDGRHMQDMFSMMRENDLIWSFVVNNYLMGREPMPFDLLYWNSDSTRLPARMLLDYLRNVYIDNGLIKPGHLVLDGVPIDVRKIKTPSYVLATKEDHIAPWQSSYPATQAFAGPVKFVLGGSGHIAGVINPPAADKYCYWTNPKAPPTADAWLASAERHEGSWWKDWGPWLARKGGKRVPARQPGGGKLAPIEDAPGSYVKVRPDDDDDN
ncbi:MAG TPA: class I poly(R)-hydroxyalkanoic acid synthase [Kiloniellaceae bacterium]|nr:class I poly(R)-hydroxyalkanoic acid synthase [Kiloniellaceae bacterium]